MIKLVDYWHQAHKLWSVRWQIALAFAATYQLYQPLIDTPLQTIFGVTLSSLLQSLAGEKWFAYVVLGGVFLTITSRVIKQNIDDTKTDAKPDQS